MTLRLSTALFEGIEKGSIHKENLEIECVDIFSGPQPYSADEAETGCRLAHTIPCLNTIGFHHEGTNLFRGVAQSCGTAGWARAYINKVVSGSNTEALRFDMSIATSGAQLNFATTSLFRGQPIDILCCNKQQLFNCLSFHIENDKKTKLEFDAIKNKSNERKEALHCQQVSQHSKKRDIYLFSIIRKLFYFLNRWKKF